MAPTGQVAPTTTSGPEAPRPVDPGDYVLSRGRYAGLRLSEAPPSYLRACASERPDTACVPRTHIRWTADVRMIRRYLEALEARSTDVIAVAGA